MLTRYAFVDHFEAAQPIGGAFFFNFFVVCTVYKIVAFGKFCYPAQACFDGGGGIVDVVAIKAETHFQSQGVAGGKADGFYAKFCPGFKNRIPYFIGVGIIKINLETIFFVTATLSYGNIPVYLLILFFSPETFLKTERDFHVSR